MDRSSRVYGPLVQRFLRFLVGKNPTLPGANDQPVCDGQQDCGPGPFPKQVPMQGFCFFSSHPSECFSTLRRASRSKFTVQLWNWTVSVNLCVFALILVRVGSDVCQDVALKSTITLPGREASNASFSASRCSNFRLTN